MLRPVPVPVVWPGPVPPAAAEQAASVPAASSRRGASRRPRAAGVSRRAWRAPSLTECWRLHDARIYCRLKTARKAPRSARLADHEDDGHDEADRDRRRSPLNGPARLAEVREAGRAARVGQAGRAARKPRLDAAFGRPAPGCRHGGRARPGAEADPRPYLRGRTAIAGEQNDGPRAQASRAVSAPPNSCPDGSTAPGSRPAGGSPTTEPGPRMHPKPRRSRNL